VPVLFVSRSQLIQRQVGVVFPLVRRFENWPRWSPWLVAAPGFELEFLDEAFSWKGEACGQGRIRMSGEVKGRRIDYELVSSRPHRLRVEVSISFEEVVGGTRVTWSMSGKLPVLKFWRKWSLQRQIGADYERGLRMLQDLAEEGVVRSRVEVPGREGCAPFFGVGIRRTVAMDDLAAAIEADYLAVREHYPEGDAVTVYHKWCWKKRRVVYVTGVRLERMPGVVADGMELFEFPGSEVFIVRHFGEFRHLGNGWAGGMMHLRAKRLKPDPKVPPFEVYEELEGADLVVRVCLPLRR